VSSLLAILQLIIAHANVFFSMFAKQHNGTCTNEVMHTIYGLETLKAYRLQRKKNYKQIFIAKNAVTREAKNIFIILISHL
jgi:hypothetical protein